MEFIVYFSLGFLSLRLLVVIYNLLSWPVLDGQESETIGSEMTKSFDLSILIPARNEAHNLPGLLNSIISQNILITEVIVLDDSSTDRTADLVRSYSHSYPYIKLVIGKDLPDHWLGKNWACHQLAMLAKGSFLLFLDADVVIKPGLIEKSIKRMEVQQLDLLSVFPQQTIISIGEKLTVPIMHYLLLSMLPLKFISIFKESSLAAANGQFMLFKSSAYLKFQFHQICKNEIVEDIVIMQMVKKLDLKGQTLLGNGLIFCRMYHNYREGVSGFSKNLLAGFGKSIPGLILYLFFTMVIPVVGLFFFPEFSLLYLVLVLILRSGISYLSSQSIFENFFLHVFQMLTLISISFNSIVGSFKNNLVWKGRKVK